MTTIQRALAPIFFLALCLTQACSTDTTNTAPPVNQPANNNEVDNNDPNNTPDAGDPNNDPGQDAGDPNNDTPDADMPDDAGDPPDVVDPPDEDGGMTDPGDPGGECDPFVQDCPLVEGAEQQCVPINGEPTCINANPDQVGEDEECQGGDCAAGFTCVNWSDGRGQICTRMCPPGDDGACGPGKVCSAWLQSNQAIGICRPPAETCDIYAQDCPDGMACTFGRDPQTEEPIFVCERAGENDQGDLCSNGNGRCQAGQICIRDDETTSTCHKICQASEECDFGEQTCSGRSSTWQVTFCR